MKLSIKLFLSSGVFAAALLSAPFSGAQQKLTTVPQVNNVYEVSKEIVLQGTVISFTANSHVAPVGAHAMIQTSAGPVDVHLGNASVLKQGEIFLAAGDSVKIIGQLQPFGNGSYFAARILQKGNQSVALRTTNGIPLSPKRAATTSVHVRQGGAQ